MSSFPARTVEPHPSTVWRDAVGPGFAVGLAESVVKVTGAAAQRPYKARR